MKVICVTGTPGTGKTTLAKKLAKKLNFYYLDVNKLISKYRLSEGYDRKRKAKIVDIKKLNKHLIKYIKNTRELNKFKGIIIDSHLSHCLPRKYADFCIAAKCGINELGKRLKKRGYSKSKITENLQAEIFDVCYNEAMGKKHRMIVINTTKGFNISSAARQIGG
ncbi:AAA family ATPase [Candidatus Woesearchaeota archaeon]|nr:AAA family ATPase [Candidatus Woesearchaeota archaeon]